MMTEQKTTFKEKIFEEKGKKWTQFPELCKSCGLCIEACPKKCLSWDESILGHFSQATIKCNIKDCIQCKICETSCPDGAIRVKD